MKQFACKDLGLDCTFSTSGSTVDEVKPKAMEHAKKVHPDLLKTATTPAQMAAMEKTIEGKIK